MKRNVGATDQITRVVIGVVLLAAVFYVEGPLRWLGLIGVLPLLTGVFGYCPAYRVFDFSTCSRLDGESQPPATRGVG